MARGNILLVEDTVDLGELIMQFLELEGYKVTWAQNGEAAIKLVATCNPQLIITDMIMPIMGGIEVIHKIRQSSDAQINKMPIIVLSARATPEDEAFAYQAGATNYIIKPCSITSLINAVQSLV
jgi:DNA-binding response OmpR family regulator